MTRGAYRGTSRWLVLSASMLVAAACSGATAESSSTASSTPLAAASSTQSPPAVQDVRTVDGQVLGGGDYPGYSVEVPDTWSTYGHFTIKRVPGVLGMSVWDVGKVPRNPCHWRGNLDDPGPTVNDLVVAIAGQPMRNATTPTDVTLGGYRGQYLEWSVPSDMVVTGDADFAGCDVWPSNGHRDFVSWVGNGYGERNQQVAGQVDLLWVLDVGGQRLVVDATYSPDTTEADRDELVGIVESIRFAA
jgi:hypothetical protein